jgi:hypothetical protein
MFKRRILINTLSIIYIRIWIISKKKNFLGKKDTNNYEVLFIIHEMNHTVLMINKINQILLIIKINIVVYLIKNILLYEYN